VSDDAIATSANFKHFSLALLRADAEAQAVSARYSTETGQSFTPDVDHLSHSDRLLLF
jgi:hypothetical protein